MAQRVEVELAADPQAISRARAFVARTLAAWDLDDLTEIAKLLTSEVTTNAVRHAGTAFRLAVERAHPQVRVEVHDASCLLPVVASPSSDAEGGRGMLLVDRLAADWGWRLVDGGKVVWFTLPAGGGLTDSWPAAP